MRSVRTYGWAAVALLVALLLVGGLLSSSSMQAWAARGSDSDQDYHLGVVDFADLLQLHPEYERLAQLDDQIQLLEQEKLYLPMAEQKEKVGVATTTIKDEVAKAEKELMAEKGKVDAELAGLMSAMKVELDRSAEALKAQYDEMIRRTIAEAAPEAPQLGRQDAERMAEFLQDLQLIRERNLAARRLELEKGSQQRMDAERQRIEAEIAAYEDELMREHQQEKLNLQLQMNTGVSPEEEAKLQERLQAISDQEATAKEQRRAELFGELEQIRAEEQGRVERESAAYQKELDVDVQRKASAEQQRLAGRAPAAPPSNEAQVKARIQEAESRLRAELAAKQQVMEEGFRVKVEQARARLEKKRAEIEARLTQLEADLKEQVTSGQDLSDEGKARLAAIEEQLAGLGTQRDELHQKMVSDLTEQIGATAQKQDVAIVIGQYVHNRNATDLTDLSMVAIKQALK